MTRAAKLNAPKFVIRQVKHMDTCYTNKANKHANMHAQHNQGEILPLRKQFNSNKAAVPAHKPNRKGKHKQRKQKMLQHTCNMSNTGMEAKQNQQYNAYESRTGRTHTHKINKRATAQMKHV